MGSGGGVPGVVLAIVRGDLQISLSESVAKKARVLADIVQRLGLPTPVLHARAEDILTEPRFNTLVVRAVARLKKLLEWFRPHWGSFDRLLVLKGPSWVEERGEARHYGLMHDLRCGSWFRIRCRAPSRRACCCKSAVGSITPGCRTLKRGVGETTIRVCARPFRACFGFTPRPTS